MTNRGEAFLKGGCGCGCLLAFAVVAVCAAALGGHAHIDFGGLILLFLVGGVLGLVVLGVYQRGRRDALVDAGVIPDLPEEHVATPRPRAVLREWPYVQPWSEDSVPFTAREALERFAGVNWSPEVCRLDIVADETALAFAAPTDQAAILRLVADEGEDVLTLELEDELGPVYNEAGPWRAPDEPNAGFQQVHRIVEDLRAERLVHVLTEVGEHRIALTSSLEQLVEASPDLRVRSWRGTHDRG